MQAASGEVRAVGAAPPGRAGRSRGPPTTACGRPHAWLVRAGSGQYHPPDERTERVRFLVEAPVSTTLIAPDARAIAAVDGRVAIEPVPAKRPRTGAKTDLLFGLAAKGAALLTLALLIGILGSLVSGAWPAISKFGLGFLTSSTWDPVADEYGGLVMIYGTLATSLHRAGDRGAGQLRHRAVSDRDGAAAG